jgi:hypothetical protein
MIYYIAFSYPIIAGALWETEKKLQWPQYFVLALSPLFLPIYLGMFISKHYNN